ncbi:MAG: hypothetical protein ACNFW9_00790 [Candidatus Kerfeldbacteria bacterium]
MNKQIQQITSTKIQTPVMIALTTMILAAVIAGGGLVYGLIIGPDSETDPILSGTPICRDSDGKDAFKRHGWVTIDNGYGKINKYTDNCETSDHVVDYYCPNSPEINTPVIRGASIDTEANEETEALLGPEFSSTEADCSVRYGNYWYCDDGACKYSCGDGQIQPELGEECDYNGGCGLDEQCNGCTCIPILKELYSNHNDKNANRVNVVFIGSDQPSINEVIIKSKVLIDLNDQYNVEPFNLTYYGAGHPEYNWLTEVKPFAEMEVLKDNLDKYNFWYLNEQLLTSCEFGADHYNWAIEKSGISNGIVYPVFLCNTTFPDGVVGYAHYNRDSYIATTDFLEMEQGAVRGIRHVFHHEFGHQAFLLRDERIDSSGSNSPGFPNCASSVVVAELWWGDLEGQVKEALDVGYFNGCSYVSNNIKGTYSSVMCGGYNLDFRYGLVNERQITNRLAPYSSARGEQTSYIDIIVENKAEAYSIESIKQQIGTIPTDTSLVDTTYTISISGKEYSSTTEFATTTILFKDTREDSTLVGGDIDIDSEATVSFGTSKVVTLDKIHVKIPLGDNSLDTDTMQLITSDGTKEDVTLTITNKDTGGSQKFTTADLLQIAE